MNSLFTTEEQRKERQKACEGCKFYKKETKSCGTFLPSKLLKAEGGDLVEIEGRKRKVRLCGCYLPAKWSWLYTECPLPAEHKRWGKTVTREQVQQAKDLLNNQEPTREWMERMFEVYNSSFARKKEKKVLTCGSCIKVMIEQLKELTEKW